VLAFTAVLTLTLQERFSNQWCTICCELRPWFYVEGPVAATIGISAVLVLPLSKRAIGGEAVVASVATKKCGGGESSQSEFH
jgi:hypothetical protein